MRLGGRAHLAAVVVRVAPLAVAHGPVAVAAAAACREAGDDSSSDVGAAVLQNKKGFIRPQVSGIGLTTGTRVSATELAQVLAISKITL